MKGLLSVSFGTSYADTREKTIDAIDAQLATSFPDRAFYTAWTSPRIIAKVKAERGEHHDTLDEAFVRLSADGVDDLVVATMCLMRGGEMRKIEEAASTWAASGDVRVRVAQPLMTAASDYERAADAIADEFSSIGSDEAVLLMGHGSPHGPNQLYADVQAALRELGKDNYFIATVEGEPTFDDVLPLIAENGAKAVHLAPFMIVAGDHARNDMSLGDDSWAARLEARGFETKVVMKGLGEYPIIQQLVVEHARAAEGA